MRHYFILQYKIINRRFTDFGLPPLLGYPLILIIFSALSESILTLSSNAVYFYCLLAPFITLRLNNKAKNDFLKTCFSPNKFIKVRLLENLILVLPFVLVLIYNREYYLSGLSIVTLSLFSRINFNTNFSLTIPTPFYKNPFEFTAGFRKNYYLIFLTYTLVFVSIIKTNFNLGLVSLIGVFVVILSFYSKVENEYYVWNYNVLPKEFLVRKIKTSILQSIILVLPILIPMSIFFTAKIDILILSVLISFIYVISYIFAKYSNFPKSILFPNSFLLVLTFIFPPLLIIMMPYLYKLSIKKLSAILK